MLLLSVSPTQHLKINNIIFNCMTVQYNNDYNYILNKYNYI